MRILSHRGLWNEPSEKNSAAAFRRSFESGFGTETDLRDQNGRIVISHDPPVGDCLSLEEFLAIHREAGPTLPLALNIKSDGLQALLSDALATYDVQEYFLFDMSTPDMRGYLQRGMNVYSRLSDVEPTPVFHDRCRGIWLDGFDREWFEESDVHRVAGLGTPVCVVSPELHGREPTLLWEKLKKWKMTNLSICTDRPIEARAFFASS